MKNKLFSKIISAILGVMMVLSSFLLTACGEDEKGQSSQADSSSQTAEISVINRDEYTLNSASDIYLDTSITDLIGVTERDYSKFNGYMLGDIYNGLIDVISQNINQKLNLRALLGYYYCDDGNWYSNLTNKDKQHPKAHKIINAILNYKLDKSEPLAITESDLVTYGDWTVGEMMFDEIEKESVSYTLIASFISEDAFLNAFANITVSQIKVLLEGTTEQKITAIQDICKDITIGNVADKLGVDLTSLGLNALANYTLGNVINELLSIIQNPQGYIDNILKSIVVIEKETVGEDEGYTYTAYDLQQILLGAVSILAENTDLLTAYQAIMTTYQNDIDNIKGYIFENYGDTEIMTGVKINDLPQLYETVNTIYQAVLGVYVTSTTATGFDMELFFTGVEALFKEGEGGEAGGVLSVYNQTIVGLFGQTPEQLISLIKQVVYTSLPTIATQGLSFDTIITVIETLFADEVVFFGEVVAPAGVLNEFYDTPVFGSMTIRQIVDLVKKSAEEIRGSIADILDGYFVVVYGKEKSFETLTKDKEKEKGQELDLDEIFALYLPEFIEQVEIFEEEESVESVMPPAGSMIIGKLYEGYQEDIESVTLRNMLNAMSSMLSNEEAEEGSATLQEFIKNMTGVGGSHGYSWVYDYGKDKDN